MAGNFSGGLDVNQLATFLAAATGAGAPSTAHRPQAQAPALDQNNVLTQYLQNALRTQQTYANTAQWAGLAQFLQQPQPLGSTQQPQPDQAPQAPPAPPKEPPKPKDPIQEKELEYRNARTEQFDRTLIHLLLAAQNSGMTRFAMIETMGTHHGHSPEWWKDYYMIFTDDIERQMSATRNFANPSSNTASTSDTRPQTLPVGHKRKARNTSPTPDIAENPRTSDTPSSSRGTVPVRKSARRCQERLQDDSDDESSDMYASGRMYTLSVPTTLPDHSPPPPMKVMPCAKGYRFTKEDQEFFVNMILWQTKLDSGVSKKTITEALYAKAPHHTVSSWETFWGRANGGEIQEQARRMIVLASRSHGDC